MREENLHTLDPSATHFAENTNRITRQGEWDPDNHRPGGWAKGEALYQELIDTLVVGWTARNPLTTSRSYASSHEESVALRVLEMALCPGDDSERNHVPGMPDSKFVFVLTPQVRLDLDRLSDWRESRSPEDKRRREALLGAVSYYASAKANRDLAPARNAWLRKATQAHLCAVGYKDPVAKRVVAAAGAALAIEAARWVREALQKSMSLHPDHLSTRLGVATRDEIQKGCSIAMSCMLDGMIRRTKQDQLSKGLIVQTLAIAGHPLPDAPALHTRTAVLAFLEGARTALDGIPRALVK